MVIRAFFRRWNSLALRIALPFALLLVGTMITLSLYLSAFVRQSYLEIMQNNLRSEVQLTADGMAAMLSGGASSKQLEDRAREYSAALGARVTVIAVDGSVLAETSTNPADMENHFNRPEVQRALQKQVSTELRYSATLRTQMLYAAAPMLAGGAVTGVARLALPIDVIRQNETNLLRSLLVATGIATLLAILLAAIIAAYTVAPLRGLTQAAGRIASGESIVISASTRGDEIGLLQRAFHEMDLRLKQQIGNLRAERGKMAAVLANMTDGVIIADAHGRVALINPAAIEMFQTNLETALGASLAEISRSHQVVDVWRGCQQTRQQNMIAIEMIPRRLYLQVIATPMDEALPGMTLLVFQDLTHVRKLETVRQDFVSNVSHELRTPLASLKALTETLQESALEDPPAARRFLGRMEVEIDNLTQMVQELLELSRIESGRVPLRRRAARPHEFTSSAVERMAVQAERTGLRLHMECPTDLPLVRADADRLEHVLVNLIHNAIKFTPPGGEVCISAKQQGDQVVFSVQDTGVGISDEALPRIFERFYKIDRSRSGSGTGLGLSIARHIVEAHGGKIWAESQENQGSTFFFTLPIE